MPHYAFLPARTPISPLRTTPPHPLTSPKPHPHLLTPAPLPQPCTLHPTKTAPTATLSPPNHQADWVIVDVQLTDLPPSETLLHQTEADAKTLVRTLLRDAPCELSVSLLSDPAIAKLNSQWRGVDHATDVLAFPQHDPDRVLLGDVVIGLETAQRQAALLDIHTRDEIRILLLHGVLHLLGYDHVGHVDGDWLVMAQMETRCMKQLGWKGEGLVAAAQQPFYKHIIAD